MTDKELEEKIKEIREKEIEKISSTSTENTYLEEIKNLDDLLEDHTNRKLIQTGKFNSVIDLRKFLWNQGSPSGVYDYPALLDGNEFIIPKDYSEENLYYDEYRKTFGLLCQRELDNEFRVLVYVSSFYKYVKDLDNKIQRCEVIGSGMENLSKEVQKTKAISPNRELTQADHMKAKAMKLCELVGGQKFCTNMRRVFHLKDNGELVSTVIYKYRLVK